MCERSFCCSLENDSLGDTAAPAAVRRVLAEDTMPAEAGEPGNAGVAALCLPEVSVVTPCPECVGKVVVDQEEEPVLEEVVGIRCRRLWCAMRMP